MDSWTNDQLRLMKLGGNDRCNSFLEQHGVVVVTTAATEDADTAGRANVVRQKYDSPAAELYKQVLKAERDGLPVPTVLPERTQVQQTPIVLGRKMEGFGSSPIPPPVNEHRMAKMILCVAVPAVVGAAVWMLVPH